MSSSARSRPSHTAAGLSLAVVLLAAACGDQPPPARPSRCTAAIVDRCFGAQQACVGDDPAAAPHCGACPSGQYAARTGACEPLTGTLLQHDFADFTTAPGQEISGLCQSWTLHNQDEIWVNAVELTQNESSHHSNWTFVPGDAFDGPDGVWQCDTRGYSQLQAAIMGGVLYAQSTQAPHEVQRFPNGAAVRIPPYSRIIGDVHVLNATSKPTAGHATLKLYSLAAAAVKVRLAPFHLSWEELDIPPHSTARHVGECALDERYQQLLGTGVDIGVYYVLPHAHVLGKKFFFEVMGGPSDGQRILDVPDFTGDAHGRAYDPPFAVKGATGFRFGCQWDNPRDAPIHYGIGDQEMCELLGFAESGLAFESLVAHPMRAGSDGNVAIYKGTCKTLAFKWSNDKSGGPPN